MTPEQFYALDSREQAELIWKGKDIAGREDEQHYILLYLVDDFFVEAYYNKMFMVID